MREKEKPSSLKKTCQVINADRMQGLEHYHLATSIVKLFQAGIISEWVFT